MQPKERRLVTERNLEDHTAGFRGLSDQAVATSQVAKTKSDNAITRVEHLETMAGLGPGEVTDAQTANLLYQPESNTNTALQHNIQRSAHSVDAGAVVDLWEPPTQPAGPALNSWSANDIYAMWDDITADDPTYVTRSSIGEGTDGLPIYAYTFAPPAYGNTVLVVGMHGSEKIGMYAVAKMMELLVNDWQSHPALAALRAKTRIVVVPIASRHAADNNHRTNANGVDLNRNWDYAWEEANEPPGTPTYKGPEPFSEPETRAIRDLVYSLQAQGGLVAALDVHDTGASVRPDSYHFYIGPPANELAGGGSWLRKLADEIAAQQGVTDPNITMSRSSNPTAKNWLSAQGLWASTVEYVMRWGPESMDSLNQTAALRWLGNVIIRSANMGSLPTQKPEPFIKRFAFIAGQTTLNVPVGEYALLEELSFEFVPPCAGFIEFYGHISVGGPTADQVNITPVAGQHGTSWGPDSRNVGFDTLYQHHGGGNTPGIAIIPFSIARGVTENPKTPVRIGIFAYMNQHPAIVYRYRGTLKFTPSGDPARFEQYSATHRLGPDAMQFSRGV